MRRRVSIVTAAICWLSISAMAVAWGAPRGGRVVIEVYPGPNAINDALDVANPGDVLNIHAGSYPEHVTVRVPRVTLQAAGDGLVTVDGTCTRGNTLAVRADGVTISRLQVVGASSGGIEVDFSFVPSGRIAGSVVQDTCGDAEYGINVFDGGSITIQGNTATGFGDAGIYVGGITNTPSGPLVVWKNESFGNDRGIIVEDSAGGTILVGRNRVDGNDTTGIWLNNSRRVRVGQNAVTDNGSSGIETDSRSTRNLIRENTVSGHPLDLVNGGAANCWLENIYDTSQGDISC